MRKFYLGMETIRITQNYDDGGHYNHSHGSPADFPIDLAGADGGKSCFFAPVDMKVTAIKGVGTDPTNTIWLVSTEKVKTPTFIDTVFMSLTHFDDNAMKWKVGDIVPAGDIITWEGVDGGTGNHLHCSFGRGYSDNWTQNSKGSWVDTGDCKKPEEVCYIYDGFSATVDTKGINFEHTDNIEYEEPQPPTPTEDYPFEGVVKKGSQLYNENGGTYNKALTDKDVTVEGEHNGRYKVYGEYFNPHIVYVDKCDVIKKGSIYPFTATIKKGSNLYDINGNRYPSSAKTDKTVEVQGEVNGRYKIYNQYFNPNIVYCDKDAIIR